MLLQNGIMKLLPWHSERSEESQGVETYRELLILVPEAFFKKTYVDLPFDSKNPISSYTAQGYSVLSSSFLPDRAEPL